MILSVKAVPARLSAPRMPGEFSSAEYYVKKGIYLKLRYRQAEDLRPAEYHGFLPRRTFFRLKGKEESLRSFLTQKFIDYAGQDAGGTAAAMVYNDKSHLSEEQEERFRSLGLSHVLVTSGTHVSLCLEYFKPVGSFLLPERKKRMQLQLFLLLLLSVLSLASVSVLRAALMKSFELTDAYKGRRRLKDNYLYLSVFCLICLCPRLALDRGLIMSSLAAQAVYIVPPLEERGSEKKTAWLMKEAGRKFFLYLRVQFFLFPFIRHFGHEYSPAAAAANLFLMPFLSLLLHVSFVFLLLSGSDAAAGLPGLMLRGGFGILEKVFSSLDQIGKFSLRFSRYHLALLPFWGVLLWIWTFQKKKAERFRLMSRALLYALLPAGLLLGAAALELKALQSMFFLDVGQGDATLLNAGEFHVLIDGGAPAQGRRLENFFHYIEMDSLDLAVVTHLDSDHKGGILDLLEQKFPVGHIVLPWTAQYDETYPAFAAEVRAAGFSEDRILFMKPGDTLRKDGHQFLACGPEALHEERNDNSLVLHYSSGLFSCLLTGDAGFEAEEAMLQAGRIEACDILHVSHHGAKSGTSDALLRKIKASSAVISCGYKNRYGHPHPDTVRRLKSVPTVVRTSEEGSFYVKKRWGKVFLQACSAEPYLPAQYAKMVSMEAEDAS